MDGRDLIRGLGELLGIAGLDLDPLGGLGLDLPGELSLGLRIDPEAPESLLVFTVLETFDAIGAGQAEDLMRISLLGDRTGGACLSLGQDPEGRDCLVLWRAWPIDLLDPGTLARELDRLAQAALRLRKSGATPGGPDAARAVDEFESRHRALLSGLRV